MTTVKESPNGPGFSPPLKSQISDITFTAAPPFGDQADHAERMVRPISQSSVSRCEFTFSDGRRCRNHTASLCLHHASKRDAGLAAEGGPDAILAELCSDLTNATSVNRALTQVFLLMAQGRISQKQAVAFGYISQLLLQTLSGVRAEYISAYDHLRWRQKLRTSLESDHPIRKVIPSEQRERGTTANSTVQRHDLEQPDKPDVERQKGQPITLFLAQKECIPSESTNADERKISHSGLAQEEKPASVPVNRSNGTEHEAQKAANSNAQIAPVAEVITLVPRTSPAAIKRIPRDFYGNPIPRADGWKSLPEAAKCIARAQPTSSHASNNSPSHSPHTPSASPATARPDQSSSRGSAQAPLSPLPDLVIRNEHSERGIPPKSPEPNSRPSFFASSPQCETPSALPWLASTAACGQRQRNGHTTEWFAPFSWSGRAPTDPYPSGATKLRSRFRSIAGSALRRMHHQNSCGFWSPGMKHLAN